MSVSVVSQVYEMTMLETNGSQKLYRYELSRVNDVLVEFIEIVRLEVARLCVGRSAVVVINTTNAVNSR